MAMPLSLRVVEAEVRTYRRTWRGSVFTSFLNPILYLLAMGVGLGSLVDANLPAGLEGVSYLAFLGPGLLVATAMQTGAGEGSWKVMAGIEWTQTWKARLATPIGIPSLVLGHIVWGALRVLMVSTIFAVVMAAFRIAPLLESLGAVVPAMFVGVAMVAATTAFTVRLKNVLVSRCSSASSSFPCSCSRECSSRSRTFLDGSNRLRSSHPSTTASSLQGQSSLGPHRPSPGGSASGISSRSPSYRRGSLSDRCVEG